MVFLGLSTGSVAVGAAVHFVTGIGLLLLATRIFTEARFWIQSRRAAGRFQGREPLTLPYTIPWLAGATRMLDGHAMYRYAE